jgi:hypothetical protein
MQKFLFLLLLCLFSAFKSDKNENKNMETQLEKLQNQLQKWQTDLISYEAWARQNDGVLDKKEKEEIKKRKEDILDIAKHILKIGKAKNLNFPFADALKTLIIKSAEKKSDNTLEIKEEAPDVKEGEFVKVLVNWAVDLDLKLTDLKKELGDLRISSTGRENISKRFTSTIPIIVEIKKVLDAKLPACVTIGEVCDILSSEAQSYHSEKNAEKHFAKNKAAYRKDKTKGNYIISPSSEQICTTLKAAMDTNDPNHPEVKAAEEAKRKEEEAKLEALKTKFDAKLLEWKTDCDLYIKFESDSFPLRNISKKLAQEQANNAFSGTSMTAFSLYIREETLKKLPADNERGMNVYNMLDMMQLLKTVIGEAFKKHERNSDKTLYEAWLKDSNIFPSPGLLRDWVVLSVPSNCRNLKTR